MNDKSVDALLRYLGTRGGGTAADELAKRLTDAGEPVFNLGAGAPAPTGDRAAERDHALLDLGVRALERALEGVQVVLGRTEGRIRWASNARFVAAVCTAVTSATLVSTLRISPENRPVAIVLGTFSLVASLFGIVADRLEGRQSKLLARYPEIYAAYSSSTALLERLRVYRADPRLFPDIRARLADAAREAKTLDQLRVELQLA